MSKTLSIILLIEWSIIPVNAIKVPAIVNNAANVVGARLLLSMIEIRSKEY